MAVPFSEEELLDLARKYSFRSRMDSSEVSGPIIVWGRGSVVRDVNGKEYLDFNSGQMCSALGHNHPRIVQALQESCETLIHSHMSLLNDREIILASRLAEISPPGMNRSMFLTSGSDSNEAAMAIAKRYTGGYEIASPMVSFHGQSDTTRAVTYSGWHGGHGPYAPGNYAMLAPYRYRCTFCRDRQACDYSCLNTSFDLLALEALEQPGMRTVWSPLGMGPYQRDALAECLGRFLDPVLTPQDRSVRPHAHCQIGLEPRRVGRREAAPDLDRFPDGLQRRRPIALFAQLRR